MFTAPHPSHTSSRTRAIRVVDVVTYFNAALKIPFKPEVTENFHALVGQLVKCAVEGVWRVYVIKTKTGQGGQAVEHVSLNWARKTSLKR